jgi:hypothetical protein
MKTRSPFRTLTFSILALAAGLLALAAGSGATERSVLFREDFRSLEAWRPVTFPKIKKHSRYSIETRGGETVLRAESSGSASGLVYRREFNVYEYPKLRWRWMIQNVYIRGDTGGKAGDDYPIRIYVMFRYDPEKASSLDRVTYGIARALYGEYPPQSTLSYVWSNREDMPSLFTSPYTGKAKLLALEKGPRFVGQWRDENVDILRDYRRAFGTDPPVQASLGIMNDSDNTGEASVSWVDFIEVYRDGR